MTAAFANYGQITARYLRAFLRQPYFILGTLIQSIIWLLLFGQLFKRVADLPGFTSESYIAFLTPGIVVMTAMLSAGWSGTSYVVDMDRGVLDRFLITPVRRSALIGGELIYQAGMVLLQSAIILGLGVLVGARFEGGIVGIVVMLVGTTLLGTAFASFSNALALLLRKQESLIALNVTLTLPLTFLSSTFLPANLMPDWMQEFAKFNPVNWAVEVGHRRLTAVLTGPWWAYTWPSCWHWLLSAPGFLPAPFAPINVRCESGGCARPLPQRRLGVGIYRQALIASHASMRDNLSERRFQSEEARR